MSEKQPQIFIKSYTNKAKLETSEVLQWHIEFYHPPECKGEIPEIGDKIQGLRIIDFEKYPSKTVLGQVKEERFYKLQADLSGVYILPSVPVVVECPSKKAENISSSEIFIEFGGKKGTEQTTKNKQTDILDIKPIIEKKQPLLYYIAPLVLVMVLLGTFLYYKKYKKRKALQKLEKPLDPYKKACDALLVLSQTFHQENAREHVFTASYILREFFETQFHLPVTDLTLEEIKQVTQEKMKDNSCRGPFIQLLEKMDFIKFTNQEVSSAEFQVLYEEISQWLKSQKPQSPDPQSHLGESVV